MLEEARAKEMQECSFIPKKKYGEKKFKITKFLKREQEFNHKKDYYIKANKFRTEKEDKQHLQASPKINHVNS
jgi:hypothetical protein